MKQIILTAIAALSLCLAASAQGIDEGVKMVKYERYNTAKQLLQPLAAGNPLANYYLGLSELGQDNIDDARAIFTKYPDDPANMAGLARIAFQQNNPTEGMRLAQMVVDKAKKKDAQPLVWAADAVNYGGGSPQQAIDWYKKALEKTDNVDIRIGLGDAYQKLQGGGGEAMNNYENAVTKEATNSLGYSRIGALWYAAQNYNDALTNYQKAKDADPKNPLPYNDLANAYSRIGKYDKSLENIEQYLQLSDKGVEDQVRYTRTLYLAKKYPEAIQKAQELMSKGMKSSELYGILAYSQLETRDSANALSNIRSYFSAKGQAKLYPKDYLTYGRILLQNGMEDSAGTYFTQSVTQDTSKDKAETYRQIAEGYKALKTQTGYAKAGEWYGKAVNESPAPKALDYYYWGFWSFYGHNYEVADQAFKAMEAKYTDVPANTATAIYWQARIAAAAKDPEAKNGAAEQNYLRWLSGSNERKNPELMFAYQYLTAYYYNKGDKAKAGQYADLVLGIEADNSFAKQIKSQLSKK